MANNEKVLEIVHHDTHGNMPRTFETSLTAVEYNGGELDILMYSEGIYAGDVDSQSAITLTREEAVKLRDFLNEALSKTEAVTETVYDPDPDVVVPSIFRDI